MEHRHPAPRPEKLAAVVMHPSALNDAQREAWERICAQDRRFASAFFDWRFADAVGSVNPQARVAVISQGARAVAFLPYQWRSGWLGRCGVAERIGGEINDYFGVVATPGFTIRPQELLALARVPALGFSHLDDSQAHFGLDGEAPRTGLRIDLGEGGEAYLGDLRKNKKSVVRETDRRLRRLAEQVGPVRLEIDVRGREDVLQTLIEAKLAQYERTGKDAPILASSWAQVLLRALYRLDAPACRGQLSALFAGDTWVAMHFGLRHAGTLHYWFPVYNPQMASYGPGRLLLQKTIESASANGIDLIDRGEGDSAVKREYANQEHQFLKGLWSRTSITGRAAAIAQKLVWRREAVAEAHEKA